MNEDRYSHEEVWEADGGFSCLDDDATRAVVTEAMTHAPTEVVDRVFDDCLFAMTGPSIRGRVLRKEKIKDKCIILLDACILEEQDGGVHTVLHEVAHYWLDHGEGGDAPWASSDLENVKKEEAEANALADQWIRET